MKNKIFIFLLFCLAFSANAQKFKGGLHLGLLATQIDGDNRGSYNKPGLFVGAFTNFSFYENRMKIQMEINYAQKGSKSTGKTAEGALNKARVALHQIEIPVLYDYMFWKGLSLEVGLSFNLNVSTKLYDQSGDLIKRDEINSPYDFKFFELGLLAGANYTFLEHYGIAFRYGYSLTRLGDSPNRRLGYRNNVLQFHFFYQF